MNIDDLQNICQQLPGTTTDIKWDDHLCFNVGTKMYLITSPDQFPHTASFKAGDDFDELCERPGIDPAPYLARYKWVRIDDISKLNKKEWEKYIGQSYRLVLEKLPAKFRKELSES